MENEPNMRYILALSNIIVAVVILLSCSAIFTVILVQVLLVISFLPRCILGGV